MKFSLLLLFLPLAFCVAQQNGSSRLDRMFDYLASLKKAEASLRSGDSAAAIEALLAATALGMRDSTVRQVDLRTGGAAAHFLLAKAHELAGDREEALASLEEAVKNGFSDVASLKNDPQLERLRADERFAAILGDMVGSEQGDRFSGKTVENQRFGMALIRERKANFPKIGEWAPDFSLPTIDGEGSVTLSSFEGKTPVALVFGSYT